MNLAERPLHNPLPDRAQEGSPIPDRFPVVTINEPLFGDDEPTPVADTIAHFYNKAMDGRTYERFRLYTEIGGLHYVLYLRQATSGYDIGFKTEEYEYALVDLSKQDRERLAESIRVFVESVHAEFPEVAQLNMAFSANDYHASDVEECRQLILADPENTMSRQDLVHRYPGGDIFNLYEERFDAPFRRKKHTHRMDVARKRYMRGIFTSLGNGWHYTEHPHVLNEATLRFGQQGEKAA